MPVKELEANPDDDLPWQVGRNKPDEFIDGKDTQDNLGYSGLDDVLSDGLTG